jgi:hypothetical protein
VLATGALGGGLVTLVYPAIRRWRAVKLRDLAYTALERRLTALWAADEQRLAATRFSSSAERDGSPTGRY